MKCGICGNTNPTYVLYGRWEGASDSTLPVQDSVDLARHKRQQHPAEYRASQQQRKDTKAEREAREQDYHKRRAEAGVKAGRTVLFRWAEDLDVEVFTTSRVDRYLLPRYRYPEPEAFALYKRNQEQIAWLQERTKEALKSAYDKGSPVSQEDVALVRAAMDAVEKETP